jgi:tetratricopeptide (TPR) repeat protein
MGAVYRAIRADGQYRQLVALKIVRADLGTEEAATRFRNERQILACLDHPNIAKILDGGTSTEGIPYFVMEFVDGVPITDYCDRHKLSIDSRLELFRSTCSAVHYAHQRLVIHRDLKPANILVTAEGVPKLLDFGIAKILDPTLLSDSAARTLGAAGFMTPEYASPEQLRGETITTASDVYSLGLVLYQLLSGHGAYRFPSRMPHDVARAILESDPEKPSVAIRRREEANAPEGSEYHLSRELVSGQRDDSIEKLRRRLAGDLDNIVLKALRKVPADRYVSADQLSEDLRRHRENLPVLARNPTLAYRCRKYVRRHRAGVTAAVLVLLSLMAGITLALREASLARANQLRAEQRFNDVRKLAHSLIFEIHDSVQNLPGATPTRKLILDRAVEYLDNLAKEVSGDSSLQRELASAYERVGQLQGDTRDANMGDAEGALNSIQKALTIWNSVAAANPRDLNDQLNLVKGHRLYSLMLGNDGKPGDRQELDQAMTLSERLLKANPASDSVLRERSVELEWMAGYHDDAGDYAGAVDSLRGALALLDALRKTNPQDPFVLRGTAVDKIKIANELAAKDKNDAKTNRELAVTLMFRNSILMMNGDSKGALECARRALGMLEAMRRADPRNTLYHTDVAGATSLVGRALTREGQRAEGLAALDRSIRLFEELRANDKSYVNLALLLGGVQIWKGEALAHAGDPSGALEAYRKALSNMELVSKESPSPKSSCDVASALTKVGQALLQVGSSNEAATVFQKALLLTEPLATAKPPNFLALYVAADAYSGLGDISSARAWQTGDPVQEAVLCKEATAWYEKSLHSFAEIPNRGPMNPDNFEAGDPARVRTPLARCQRWAPTRKFKN